jgi:hypothetical protein
MVIIETSIFTKLINSLMTDEDYHEFQIMLIDQPDAGKIIPGSGGIRKIRWSGSGRGKRGGSRLIYYWATNLDQIYMLFAYAKNERENLTKEQLKTLQKIVVQEFENE